MATKVKVVSTDNLVHYDQTKNYVDRTTADSLYVAQVEGKGLSTNDYATTDKEKLNGIEDGAQVNEIEGISVNGTPLAVAQNKTVDLRINGRNLALETNRGIKNWQWNMASGGKTITESKVDEVLGVKLARDSSAQSGYSVIFYSRINWPVFEPKTNYTISFEVKPSVATSFSVALKKSDATGTVAAYTGEALACPKDEWTKCWFVVQSVEELPKLDTQGLYITGFDSSPNVSYEFRNLKIEEGTVATNWIAAPEDYDFRLKEIEEKLDEILAGTLKVLVKEGA